MKLIIREKKEILDIEDFEFRRELDFGFFLFEFLAFDFDSFTPDADAELPETLLSGEGESTEILRYLIDTEPNINALYVAQKIFRFACNFCLDMDYAEYPLDGLLAQQKWYILSKSEEYTDLREFIEQLTDFSEYTSIIQPGETFYSDALLHTDTGEIDEYFDEPLTISELIEKYRNTTLETLKIYETDSLLGLMYAEFWSMVTANVRIRKCKFCGKYFIPFSENSEYCARMVPGKGKSCKEYAPMVIFRQRIAEDDLRAVYKKAEAARYMRHQRNPALHTWEKFEAWRKMAKAALAQARRGELSTEEFAKRIKNIK